MLEGVFAENWVFDCLASLRLIEDTACSFPLLTLRHNYIADHCSNTVSERFLVKSHPVARLAAALCRCTKHLMPLNERKDGSPFSSPFISLAAAGSGTQRLTQWMALNGHCRLCSDFICNQRLFGKAMLQGSFRQIAFLLGFVSVFVTSDESHVM